MDSNYQRVGAISNTHVGRDFEALAKAWFARQGLSLVPGFRVHVGYHRKKQHAFDLGSDNPATGCEPVSVAVTVFPNPQYLDDVVAAFSKIPGYEVITSTEGM